MGAPSRSPLLEHWHRCDAPVTAQRRCRWQMLSMTISLRVLTLNTWGLPWPISSVSPTRRYPLLARFLRERAFDVAALQEVWRGTPGLDVQGMTRPDHGTSGLALASPHRVEVVRNRRYGRRRLLPFGDKGVLHTRIFVDDTPITILNTHLQAYASAKDARSRARQTDIALEEAQAVDGPVILLGDFNFYEDSAVDRASVDRITRAGFHDSLGERPPQPTFHHTSETERFDRIFVRDGGGHRFHVDDHHVEHWRFGRHRLPFLSDHLAVEVALTLTPG